MTIVAHAINFLTSLLRPPSRPVCPRCGCTVWKKSGSYQRGQRCLGRLEAKVHIQRYRCKSCGGTWSEKPPWLAPKKWYGRDVIRMSLDLAMDCTTSWRELSSLARAILTDTGRALRWAPWRKPKPGAEQAKLAHTTVWRWFQEAAHRGQEEDSIHNRYQGLFSGVLATDESWGWLKGIVEGVGRKVGFGIQVLVDGQTRLVLRLRRLRGESEEALRVGIEELAGRGIALEALRAWLSDGLRTYEAILEMLNLSQLPRQRSVFHLWRNLAGELKVYAEERSKEQAEQLRKAIRRVWDAQSEREAVVALMALVRRYSEDPLAGKTVWLVRSTFKEAMLHLKGIVPGLARTSGVAEWVWRFYKRRLRLLQCFMSEGGADSFLDLYELYLNFHRYQIRKERKRFYPYPGKCPLEIAGVSIEVEVAGRRVAATWMDALSI